MDHRLLHWLVLLSCLGCVCVCMCVCERERERERKERLGIYANLVIVTGRYIFESFSKTINLLIHSKNNECVKHCPRC